MRGLIHTFGLVALIVLAAFAGGCGANDPSSRPWEVYDLVTADVTGEIQVVGALFDNGDGLVICDALAESFPPQCPGPSIRISNPDDVVAEYTTSGSVRWTDTTVTLDGEMVDGELQVK